MARRIFRLGRKKVSISWLKRGIKSCFHISASIMIGLIVFVYSRERCEARSIDVHLMRCDFNR